MDMTKTRLAVLISGNGSNLQALIDAIRMRVLDAEIVVVVSNRQKALGVERATKAGVPTEIHLLRTYTDDERTRTEYDADLAVMLKGYRPDFVVLAGWMHILSDAFVRHFSYRIINLHPALPGKFPGANAVADALAAFERGEIKETGAMVHLVTDERVNVGPVLGTQEVIIYPNDSKETLAKRIRQAEHVLLVKTLDRLICGDTD